MKKLPLLILCFGLTLTPLIKAGPISGVMGFEVFTTVGSTIDISTDVDNWTTTPESLSVNAMAFANQFEFPDPNGGGSGAQDFSTVFGNGTASWAADGNSGSVQMNYGWLTGGPNAATQVQTWIGMHNWSYSFIADSDGLFVMDFSVTATGDDRIGTFGLVGWSLVQNFDSGSGSPIINVFDPTNSGQFIGQVTAGQYYTVALVNGGNIVAPEPMRFPLDAQASGSFNWSITGNTVPDNTSSLALLGLGLAVFGAIRRKMK